MQFSIFKNQLSSWQGRSLIIGLNEEFIDPQLETIKFFVDLKQLRRKLNNINFNGEIGKSISIEILGHNLDHLTIIGLGKKNKMNSNTLRDSLSECIRKVIDKEEKIGILMPWEALDKNAVLISPKYLDYQLIKIIDLINKEMKKLILKKLNF